MARISDVLTMYTDGQGQEHHAVQLTWEKVRGILGRDHDGSAEDDAALIEALQDMGAPAWVTQGQKGWTDEHGWRLIGPQLVSYEVIEDNGGGLHLVVFDGNGNVVYYARGMSTCPTTYAPTLTH